MSDAIINAIIYRHFKHRNKRNTCQIIADIKTALGAAYRERHPFGLTAPWDGEFICRRAEHLGFDVTFSK